MGAYLSSPKTEKFSEEGRFFNRISWAASGMQGWRTTMEDAHLAVELDENTCLFGVYDGHGGKEAAIWVAKQLPIEIVKNQSYKQGNYEAALKETYLLLDRLMETPAVMKELWKIQRDGEPNMQSGQEQNYWEYCGAGCTAVTALINKNMLYVANSGDSRCVLGRAWKAIDMTFDHKPDLEVEKQRIAKAGGQVFDGRVNGNLNLSRSLGDLEYKRNKNLTQEEQMITANPDIKVIELKPEDFLVLACDGIWDIMSNQDSITFIKDKQSENMNLKQICESMFDNCIASDVGSSQGLGCDNMTAIIAKLN